MLIQIIILIIGFILLIKGADIFVDGASSTAENFHVSKMLIGLTIVAFGTSAPELAVSLKALSVGSGDIVLGNVIGSNITNGLLILGVSIAIRELTVKQNTVKKELPLHILITLLLVTIFLDKPINAIGTNMVTRSDALVILLFFSVFLYYIISISRNKIDEEQESKKYSLPKSLLFVALGLTGIVIGSDFVVNSATEIAKDLGVSERVISLTIVAFGTSLPELVTSIVSTIKKEQDILVGNIIGSNIFNICIVLGLPVAIFGSIEANSFQILDLITIIVTAVFLYVIPKFNKYKFNKISGFLLIAIYVIYYTLVFVI